MGTPADGERDIVTSGAIVITAAIGTDASQRGEQASLFNYAIGRCFRRSRACCW
jgi:hypothetical protein